MQIKQLAADVAALEAKLGLDETTRAAIVDEVKRKLSNSPDAQTAYTKLSETQARARMRAVTHNFVGVHAQGQTVSYYELYQALDNETVWKRNVDAATNKAEFLEANLAHIRYNDKPTPTGEASFLSNDFYKAAIKDFAEGLMPFLIAREQVDLVGLQFLQAAFEEHAKGQ